MGRKPSCDSGKGADRLAHSTTLTHLTSEIHGHRTPGKTQNGQRMPVTTWNPFSIRKSPSRLPSAKRVFPSVIHCTPT